MLFCDPFSKMVGSVSQRGRKHLSKVVIDVHLEGCVVALKLVRLIAERLFAPAVETTP